MTLGGGLRPPSEPPPTIPRRATAVSLPDHSRHNRGGKAASRTAADPAGRGATPSDVILYCDGACSGNPGPGGWAALIIDGGAEREVTGGEAHTTNQRMEIRAALEGLAAIPGRRRVHVHSDSAYVVNCFRDRWWERWERSGWIGANKQPVANRDLWELLLAETRRHDAAWHKVRGHSGDALNERVDALARQAIRDIGGNDRRSPG